MDHYKKEIPGGAIYPESTYGKLTVEELLKVQKQAKEILQDIDIILNDLEYTCSPSPRQDEDA